MRPRDVAQGEHRARAAANQVRLRDKANNCGFPWRRFIVRRSATRDRADVGVNESKTIFARDGCGLVRKSGAIKLFVKKIAGAIAGEHAPGAIRAVRRGSEADDQELRVRIAESRDRPAPILLIAIRAALGACDFFAVANQARTFAALNDLSVEYD